MKLLQKEKLQFILSCTLAILTITYSSAQSMTYPETPKHTVSETMFHKVIIDEYRWMKNSHHTDVREWVEQQNALTKRELLKSGRKYSSFRMIDKYSFIKYDNPQKVGDYYFTYGYYNNVSVPALFVRNSVRDEATLLVDPNFISAKDKLYIQNISASFDSKLLAYQFSRNGSDWGEIQVVNIRTGIHKKDHFCITLVGQINWMKLMPI